MEKMEELNNDMEEEYFDNRMDETEYLMSTEANRKSLLESIKQIQEGDVVKITPEDLWKWLA